MNTLPTFFIQSRVSTLSLYPEDENRMYVASYFVTKGGDDHKSE